MNNETELLRLFSITARELVAGARKKSVTRFNDSLEKMHFIVTDFDPAQKRIEATATMPAVSASPQIMKILMLEEAKFGKFIASEAHRFYLASLVSLERSRQSQPHNLAWQVVEHYYAAYYSVHYLMRISGFSLSNLDDKAVKAFKKSALVPLDKLQAGLSTLEFTEDCRDITIIKNDKGGGSHKDAWSIWTKILNNLIIACQSDPVEYASTAIKLIEHRRFIAVNDKKFNPSDIRGEVNYQFRGDSWCFEEKTNDRINMINQELIDDDYDLFNRSDRIQNLINNNKFIINLARVFFEYSMEAYPNGICKSIRHQFKNKISII
ncbi:hypothetical protein Y71_03155 [Kosakonia radicincitans DSM 16656]|uniref:hypothetical protein n=1 Tax=Kosakonia radicincitans TaxID=283686 RepID=UPI000272E9D4|nr:hypothetical protein [Kosakonia radicincitans]ARD58961.1 hypothetical protein Y71_03155 [Kosakonia radicincitans DSM 16656]